MFTFVRKATNGTCTYAMNSREGGNVAGYEMPYMLAVAKVVSSKRADSGLTHHVHLTCVAGSGERFPIRGSDVWVARRDTLDNQYRPARWVVQDILGHSYHEGFRTLEDALEWLTEDTLSQARLQVVMAANS